ncbi:MAG: hypothetical protein CSB16_02425 [Clostridiales bacterium]|nr:MAG: hypothetical protein CSB16_02425 [Clostridiales bacterium]
MKFVRIDRNKCIRKKVKGLYIEAFPKEERLNFNVLLHKAKGKKADFLAVYEDDRYVGLVYLIHYEDSVFLFFFAIVPELRGMGYGSKVLRALRSIFADKKITLLIESTSEECDNLEERLNRKLFYEKNGFVACGYELIEKGVRYDCMSSPVAVSKESFSELLKDYWGKVIYKVYYRI